MRIAVYFNGRQQFGGAERRLSRVFNLIASRGIEVFFVFYLYDDFESIKKEYLNVLGNRCNIKFIGFCSFYEIFIFMKKERFHKVLYTGVYRSMLPFFIGAKLNNSKTILLQVSTGPSIWKFDSFLKKMLFITIGYFSSQIDCLYPKSFKLFSSKFPKSIISVSPCPATDTLMFKPKSKDKILAFISRWVEGKNVVLFLNSMLLIEEELHEYGYKVYLCGGGDDILINNKISHILSLSKYKDLFVLPGYINSKDILPKTEVFFSLQNINNYPSQSLLEAISCGCFIIASNEGDTNILVKNTFGFLCELNVKSIVECTLRYLRLPDKIKTSMQKQARLFAKENFQIENSVEHYLKIIE